MKRKPKKEINIELIPIYIPDNEFQEKKAEIQNLIARMIIDGSKRLSKKCVSKSSEKAAKAP